MAEKRNNKYELSWKAAFDAYGLKDLLWDSKIPFIISIILLLMTVSRTEFNEIEMIEKMCSLLLAVLPPLLSILIASFSIWISFFLSRTFEKLEENDNGRIVLYGLNASFLITILFMLISLIITILVYICLEFNLPALLIDNETGNVIILFVLYFLSIEFVWLLKDIAKNLHNVAKFAILFER